MNSCNSIKTLTFLGIFLFLASFSNAVEFNSVTHNDKSYTVCTVDPKTDSLDLYLYDDKGTPFYDFSRLAAWLSKRKKNLVFAMNAGMYREDYSPCGLFVTDSRVLSPLNLKSGQGNFYLKPNGVFLLTKSGARVIASTEYPEVQAKVILATQSGPLLSRRGRINPVFEKNSDSLKYRNGVGVNKKGLIYFVISDTCVNFYEFATLFTEKLQCPDALFLDGSISSLYAPAIGRNDFRAPLGPIIGVTTSTPQ